MFFCMAAAGTLARATSQWLPAGALALAVGTFVSVWVSRKIAGPLYRIEKDLEALLSGAFDGPSTRPAGPSAGCLEDGHPIHLREGDPLQHLAALVNRLMERTRK